MQTGGPCRPSSSSGAGNAGGSGYPINTLRTASGTGSTYGVGSTYGAGNASYSLWAGGSGGAGGAINPTTPATT